MTQVDLDNLEYTDDARNLLEGLCSRNYILNGKSYGNNIGINMERKGSKVTKISSHRLTIRLAKNLTNIGLRQLMEITEAYKWDFVINRTKSTLIEVDFFRKI